MLFNLKDLKINHYLTILLQCLRMPVAATLSGRMKHTLFVLIFLTDEYLIHRQCIIVKYRRSMDTAQILKNLNTK